VKFIEGAIAQPVTVLVGVIAVLLSGLIALRKIPIQLTPNVEDTIVTVSTYWEGASPEEIEQEIIDEQEEKLQGIANLREMTSQSLQGTGTIRLEFAVGTSKELALREVSDKLREVPRYPENAYEPVVTASDQHNRDYIAWIVFETSDPELDIRTWQDFAEDRIKPTLERVPGMSEINVLGGREREVQVRFDPGRLALHGLSIPQLIQALKQTNRNISGGEIPDGKADVRLRLVGQYGDVRQIERTVVAETDAGPVRVSDVAEVEESFKEAQSFVHARGRPVIAINAQKEVGANVMEVMAELQAELARMNTPGGLLESAARTAGLEGTLTLRQVYNQTTYIDDALLLVRNNIWIGGGLAMLVLLLFLRSLRSAGIIALAIPISIIGAVAVMVAIGRTVNVISLAGMAFAVGMVVDNAIVVLENVFRHLEMGKTPKRAARDGTREVFGAVLASTLTTVAVFVPVLLIEDEAGQLFRDIALAIIASVTLSLVVSVTLIPMSAARLMRARKSADSSASRSGSGGRVARLIGGLTYRLGGSVIARVLLVILLTSASIIGSFYLMPPSDYLPQGNRNLVFGMLIPPPGYNLEQRIELAKRVEDTIRPFWEAGDLEVGSVAYARACDELPEIPTFDFSTGGPGEPVIPPPLENYFIVGFPGGMFHGGISTEPSQVVDYLSLFRHATRAEAAPGVLAFAFQVPLFQLGGSTGSAVKINFAGDDLDAVAGAALSVYLDMIERFGVFSVQPDPSNFNLPGPELQVIPDLVRLSEVGLTSADLGLAVQTLGDGAIIGDYRIGGRNVDLKVMSLNSLAQRSSAAIGDAPVATPAGVVPLNTLAELRRVNSAPQINREGRRRAVTLQFTPPEGLALEQAIAEVDSILAGHRERGTIPREVSTGYSGSASKLASVQAAMFGDGSLTGTLGSTMVLALLVVYLLMCVLFQSFVRPLIIMFSVPLATLGGFAALFGVFLWSLQDPYMPMQSLDILTILGFVILIGVVVNNAILIVHQARNFMLGGEVDSLAEGETMTPRRAIAEAVRTRVRPIFMSTLTSVGGMAPLVFMPGSGSELYRGLGSVVVGGLLISTVFTLLLVPALLSLVTDLQAKLGVLAETRTDEDEEHDGPGAARIAGGVVLLLLFATPLLFGCTSAPPTASPRTESLMQAVIEDQLALLGPPEASAYQPEFPPSEVNEVLGDRLEELDATGGSASYEALDLAIPRDLSGVTEKLKEVDLDWAVRSASAYNLGIRFRREMVLIAEEEILVAEAEFDSSLFSDLFAGTGEIPNTVPEINGIRLGNPASRSDNSEVSVGMSKKLYGGATVTGSTSLSWYDDRSGGIQFSPDPSYRTAISLEVAQPLLRGYGSELNLAEVTLRRNEYQRSEHILREDLLTVMNVAENAYRDLQEAWKLLAIQQLLTDRGERIERVLRERLAFDASPAEYSDALATLEQRRANLIRAQRVVALASDRLKAVVNDPEQPLASEGLLVPSDELLSDSQAISLHQAVGTALRERPEVLRAMLLIEDSDIRTQVARNLKDPQLDLRAGAAAAGLDDDPGSSYGSLMGDDYYRFYVGLTFETPVGNRAASARERQALISNRASILAFEETLRDVILEVREALRNLQTDYALVGAARAYRLAQTENLRALVAEQEQRSDLTPEFLNLMFQRQERLAEAQFGEVRALAGYNRAVAALHRAMGMGMGGEPIEVKGGGS
jgi:hydrophobic/amphiphilic exporter-1 (mainly G- bacteria), HAE1 family